jgi:uncharacterized protein YdaT
MEAIDMEARQLIWVIIMITSLSGISYAKLGWADGLAGQIAYSKKDYRSALIEFGSSAKQGDEIAQCGLGRMYLEGKGVPQNYQVAADWFEKANAQGNALAQYYLAKMYLDGLGVKKDLERSALLMELSANHGCLFAMYSMGMMYQQGLGVPISVKDAHKWFNVAASSAEVGNTSEWVLNARKERKKLESSMTPEQIEQAQKLASDWNAWRMKIESTKD